MVHVTHGSRIRFPLVYTVLLITAAVRLSYATGLKAASGAVQTACSVALTLYGTRSTRMENAPVTRTPLSARRILRVRRNLFIGEGHIVNAPKDTTETSVNLLLRDPVGQPAVDKQPAVRVLRGQRRRQLTTAPQVMF